MTDRWPGCIKIHEGCGGHVRWVEAVQRPGIGYHGECLECCTTELPVERIVPVELPDDILQAQEHEYWVDVGLDSWRDLVWDDRRSWETNQHLIEKRLKG